MDVLTVYALKTTPAFEVALYAGLRAAARAWSSTCSAVSRTYPWRGIPDPQRLGRLAADDHNKRIAAWMPWPGGPPFSVPLRRKAAHAEALSALADGNGQVAREQLVDQVRQIYCHSGAFAKAEQLLGKLRARAIATAADFPSADLQELMRFLVRRGAAGPARTRGFGSMSAFAVSGLAGRVLRSGMAGLSAAFVDSQVRFVAGCQQPDGGFRGRQGGSDLYYTDFALRTLALLLPDHAAFGRAAGYLAHPPRPPRGRSNASTSSTSRRLLESSALSPMAFRATAWAVRRAGPLDI